MAALVPLRNPELARELAQLAVKLAAHYDLEAMVGLEGADEAAQSWTNLAERLKRHLRDDDDSVGVLMSRR